jgi:hypothetical protein
VPGDQRRHELEANRDRRELHLSHGETYQHTNMDGLYPIIRRVRRPLVPVEATPAGRPVDVKPAAAAVQGPKAVNAQQDEQPKQEGTHGEAAATERAE